MPKSNRNAEDDNNVVRVSSTLDLPYAYIPYYNIEHARAKHPDAKLYVFEPGAPAGYRIVAFPILMTKPVEDQERIYVKWE